MFYSKEAINSKISQQKNQEKITKLKLNEQLREQAHPKETSQFDKLARESAKESAKESKPKASEEMAQLKLMNLKRKIYNECKNETIKRGDQKELHNLIIDGMAAVAGKKKSILKRKIKKSKTINEAIDNDILLELNNKMTRLHRASLIYGYAMYEVMGKDAKEEAETEEEEEEEEEKLINEITVIE